jgi:hypothetical protein
MSRVHPQGNYDKVGTAGAQESLAPQLVQPEPDKDEVDALLETVETVYRQHEIDDLKDANKNDTNEQTVKGICDIYGHGVCMEPRRGSQQPRRASAQGGGGAINNGDSAPGAAGLSQGADKLKQHFDELLEQISEYRQINLLAAQHIRALEAQNSSMAGRVGGLEEQLRDTRIPDIHSIPDIHTRHTVALQSLQSVRQSGARGKQLQEQSRDLNKTHTYSEQLRKALDGSEKDEVCHINRRR